MLAAIDVDRRRILHMVGDTLCLQKAAQPEAFTTHFIAPNYGHRFG
jgi:hypothetical protein